MHHCWYFHNFSITATLERSQYKPLVIPFKTQVSIDYTLIPDNFSWAEKCLHCFDLQPHSTVRLFVRSDYLILGRLSGLEDVPKRRGPRLLDHFPSFVTGPACGTLHQPHKVKQVTHLLVPPFHFHLSSVSFI